MAKGWQKGWRSVYNHFIQTFYRNQTCERCGSTKPPFHYHHIDPTKKNHDIIHMWSYSDEKIEAEIKKCEILCEKCHRNTYTYGRSIKQPIQEESIER